MYTKDDRTVITLDAGGTNFVFGAMKGCEFVTEPLSLPANSDDLDRCLATLAGGFREIISRLDNSPVAISFAFPGPADYPNGIIAGNLPNFPSFRRGVALGPFLKKQFGVPVFINNDGNLFAYGEALYGTLPEINARLAGAGSDKRYRNLIGITFGTGFGCGAVINGRLLLGDNACGGDIWCFPNKRHPEYIIEESVSIRAVKRVYKELSGDGRELTPRDIFDIAEGRMEGNADAARGGFADMGRAAGDALAVMTTVVDGIVVMGGGLTGASKYIVPPMIEQMQGELGMFGGDRFCRMQQEVLDLDDEAQLERFCTKASSLVKIHGTEQTAAFDPWKRTGVITSSLGASRAISVGAYIFALNKIDGKED